MPRLVGAAHRPVRDGRRRDASRPTPRWRTRPAVLFDALVLPDGEDGGGRAGAATATPLEFVKDQYRHCKTILALGASQTLLAEAKVDETLPSGEADPGSCWRTRRMPPSLQRPSSARWACIAIPRARPIRPRFDAGDDHGYAQAQQGY